MSNNYIFEGAAVAIVTPFNEKGVDYEAFGKLIDFQIEKGIDAILVCGTTGEASTMPDDEHMEVIRFAVEKVNKRVPVIAGTGSNYTHHAIELSKYAESVGADAILSVSPYYNKTTQKGLVAHFTAIANSVKIPVILYNVPTRTSVNINPETIAELSKVDNIVAVKECNMTQVSDVISQVDSSFAVYSGDDNNILSYLAMGGKGVISVLANVMPKETHDISTLFLEGKVEESRALYYKTLKLANTLFIETNPITVKTAVNLMGMNAGLLRLPLVEMDEKNIEILKKEMQALNLI